MSDDQSSQSHQPVHHHHPESPEQSVTQSHSQRRTQFSSAWESGSNGNEKWKKQKSGFQSPTTYFPALPAPQEQPTIQYRSTVRHDSNADASPTNFYSTKSTINYPSSPATGFRSSGYPPAPSNRRPLAGGKTGTRTGTTSYSVVTQHTKQQQPQQKYVPPAVKRPKPVAVNRRTSQTYDSSWSNTGSMVQQKGIFERVGFDSYDDTYDGGVRAPVADYGLGKTTGRRVVGTKTAVSTGYGTTQVTGTGYGSSGGYGSTAGGSGYSTGSSGSYGGYGSSGGSSGYSGDDYSNSITTNGHSLGLYAYGNPGVDFPIYRSVPRTGFSCSGRLPGYYADVRSGCQAFYICQSDGRMNGFLCPNATLFSQQLLTCDYWNNVDCDQAERYYSVNEALYQQPLRTTSYDQGSQYDDGNLNNYNSYDQQTFDRRNDRRDYGTKGGRRLVVPQQQQLLNYAASGAGNFDVYESSAPGHLTKVEDGYTPSILPDAAAKKK